MAGLSYHRPTAFAENAAPVSRWAILSLFTAILSLFWAPNPSPLQGWLESANYHYVHLSWNLFQPLLICVVLATPLLTLVAAAIGFRHARRWDYEFHGIFLIAVSLVLLSIS
jgi:hypothetical protein